MSLEALVAALPEGQRKHLDPSAPIPMRMMAAKGLAPLPPREMVIVLCGHRLSDDEKLANAAQGTLADLPDKLLLPVLNTDVSAILDGVADCQLRAHADSGAWREVVLEQLVTNRASSDDALAALAPVAPAAIAEIIAGNQERCMRSEALVDGIRQNKDILKSSLDRLFDFLVRSGVVYGDMAEFDEALGRLSPTEMAAAADNVELPEQLRHLLHDGGDGEENADDEHLNEVARTLDDRLFNEEEAHERIPMLKLINSLTTAQKVALALKGNKEARTILIRERNKLVAAATIKSPRITEPEIVAAAKSRSVSDEVIRIICRSKDMTRPYAVKKSLVYNPKTPQPVSMRFLTLLRSHDLKELSKSKNVPSSVSMQAKRLLQRKK